MVQRLASSLQPEYLSFKGKTILVSGGAGFLASGLVDLLKDVDCQIIRMHRAGTSPSPVSGTARISDAEGDVRDPTIWERFLERVDYIFHFAAQTSAYVANDDPITDQTVNVQPLLHLLESCRRKSVMPTVCFASTVTVAGVPIRLPVNENHPDHPLTIYDLHKLMAEQYLRWYAEQGVVRGVTLRLANVYGPGPPSSRSDRGVLNQMMRRALAGEDLTLYGTGKQVRDYLYVKDAARAFLAAAQHSETLNGRYFVIGSGQGHTIAEAMELVAERAGARIGRPVTVQRVTPPRDLSPIEQRHFIADSRQFQAATGWRPGHTLLQGIELTLDVFSHP